MFKMRENRDPGVAQRPRRPPLQRLRAGVREAKAEVKIGLRPITKQWKERKEKIRKEEGLSLFYLYFLVSACSLETPTTSKTSPMMYTL